MLSRVGSAAVAAWVTVMAVGVGAVPACADEAVQKPDAAVGEVTVVATGLQAPWSIAFYGKTALVSERDAGRILAFNPGGAATPVATIAGVEHNGEGGLLGIAVHDGYLYVYLTAANENRIERYKLERRGELPKLGTREKILGGIPAARYHNGGRIAFGPDGMLYAATGDARERPRAQDLTSLAGKILRMTPEGKVPKDNPFAGSYVYSYGHRNVQGLAWAADGTLYASEFGENTWDELNIIRPGGNYGWPAVEGKGGQQPYIDPVQQWAPATASPSGMAIRHGKLYLANLRGERLRMISVATPQTASEHFVKQYGRLRDVVNAPDGTLWILTNNTDSRGLPRPGDDRILSIRPR